MSESISRRNFLKTAAVAVAGASVVSLVGCASGGEGGGGESGTSGTATATAMGKGGDVEVTVTVENDAITAVEIVGENETPTIGGIAIEEMPQQILDAQSFDVEGVAGATLTSDAIRAAGQEAYDQIMSGAAE